MPEGSLILEVDGSGHARTGEDAVRDRFLLAKGHSALRFWNPEVLENIDAINETTVAALDGRLEANERYLKANA